MSTQDSVYSRDRKSNRRRAKFGATLEDLEGRVLLSSIHHVEVHRAAHVRVLPVHHAKPASHARVATPREVQPLIERTAGTRHRRSPPR